MNALYVENYGGLEEMKFGEIPEPTIKDNQILVEVYACSVNPVDWKVRKGTMKFFTGKKFPKVFGTDYSGIVKRTGEKVTNFQPGDEVYGGVNIMLGNKGANAEYVVVTEKDIFYKPKDISFVEAASLPVGATTALKPLIKAGIQQDDPVLINGASGGVGIFAVQIAKLYGAEVTAVCSKSKTPLVKQLGADSVIDYHTEDFTKNGKVYTGVFEASGKLKFSDVKKSIEKGGFFINTLGSPLLVIKSFFPFLTGRKIMTVNGQPSKQSLEDLKDLVEGSKLKTHIEKIFPLSEGKKAYELQESGASKGKIVIRVNNKEGNAHIELLRSSKGQL